MPCEKLREIRALILGIDGASWPLVERWVAEGKLPNIGALLNSGVSGPLTSTTPPYSPPAWSTFMTGCNPGRHGIYDFVAYRGGSYRPSLISGGHRAVPTIWRLLSEAGIRVGVVNVPFTYPPEPVNGFMISGMDAPAFDARSVFPTDLYDDIQGRFPAYDMSPVPRRGDSYDLTALAGQASTLVDVALHLHARQPVDVLAIVFPGVDHVSHRCWHARRVRWQNEVVDDVLLWTYQQTDAAIGRLVEAVPEEAVKIILSDHGFMGIDTVVNLNGALRDAGLLVYRGESRTGGREARSGRRLLGRLRAGAKRSLSLDAQRWLMRRFGLVRRLNWSLRAGEIDWSKTRVFTAGPFGMMRLNLRGREAQGWVDPGDTAKQVLSEAEVALKALRDPASGKRLVARLAPRDELYRGERAAEGPDAVVVLKPAVGCYLPPPMQGADTPAVLVRGDAAEGYGVRQEGTHDFDGVLVIAGARIPSARRARTSIADLAPTLLTMLGQPVPEHMDGTAIAEALGDAEVKRRPQRQLATADESREAGYTDEDVEEIEERLRSLGYM